MDVGPRNAEARNGEQLTTDALDAVMAPGAARQWWR